MHKMSMGVSKRATAIIVAVIIIIVALVAGYYFYQPRGTQVAGTIKIGFTISMTGTYNVEGKASLNGILTAVRWINEHGGVTIQGKSYNVSLVYHDDQSKSENIVPLYTQLVQQEGAQFLLAPYSSGLTAAAAPLADRFGIIMISHGGASDSIWAQGYKNVFGVLSPASYYLKVAVDWLKANHPNDKIAFIYAGDPFSTVAANSSINYAKQLGLQVVYTQSYPTNANDLTPLLTAARSAGADDIIGGGHFTDGQLIMTQLQQIGWKPKFISLLVAVTEPQFQSTLGNAANAVTGPSQWESSVKYSPDVARSLNLEWFGPTPSEFTQLYRQVSNGANPTYHSAEAAAAIFVLVKAIESANSLDTSAVRQSLLNLHFMTFFGEYHVDSNGKQVAHSMVLVQWQNGVLRVVYPTQAAEVQVIYPYGS